MRVAIVGSREFRDLSRVRRFVADLAAKYPDAIVVSGGCRGVDAAAEEAAQKHYLDVISYPVIECPNWEGKPGFTIKVKPQGAAATAFTLAHRNSTPPWFPTFGGAAFCRNYWIAQDGEQVVVF